MPGVPGSYVITIDNDNDDTNRVFVVDHDAGGAGNECFQVSESGIVTVYNTIEKAGDIRFDRTVGTGDLVRFQAGGTDVAKIHTDGLGDFDQQGVRLPVETNDPNGLKSGVSGQVVLWDNAGTYTICVGLGGTAWQHIT